MKSSKALFAAIVFITVFALSLLNACKKDESTSCSDGIKNQDETGIDCGGVCSACVCSLGYEGTGCLTQTRAKYFRTDVEGTDSCNSGVSRETYTISTDPAVTKVNIVGPNANINYIGTVQPDGSIRIESPLGADMQVSGTVILVSNKLRVTYTKTVPGTGIVYSCVWMED
jgi:hypothetical protein